MKKTFLILVSILIMMSFSACFHLDKQENELPSQSPGESPQQSPSESPSDEPSPSQTEEQAASIFDYFPFEGDVYYKYTGSGNEYAPMDAYVDYLYDNSIQLSYDNGGTVMGKLYVVREGELVLIKSVGEFYLRQDLTELPEDKNEIILKEPIQVGTSWTNGESKVKITSVNSIVDTPLGQFEAIEVTAENPSVTTKTYYAKDVGMIKTVITGESEITQEIQERDTGVPLEQYFRFYYPKVTTQDFEIVYSDLETQMFTNMGIREVVEKSLQRPPEGSLQVVIPKSATIRNLSFDSTTKTAYIDLSKTFILDMNTGSEAEGAVLDCLTNTICGIFNAEGMIITIEGQAYESGHFAFDINEGLKPKYDEATELK